MKNIPILGKFLILMGALGVFGILSSGFASYQIWNTNGDYQSLLDHQVKAAIYVSRSNRAMQNARAALADLVIIKDAAAKTKSADELASSRDSFMKFMDVAISAQPEDQGLQKLKSDGLTILDQTCRVTISFARTALSEQQALQAQEVYLRDCQSQFPLLSSKAVEKFTELVTLAEKTRVETDAVATFSLWSTLGGVVSSFTLIMAGGWFAMRSSLVRPLKVLAGLMDRLSSGDLTPEIDATDRRDEIGHMARALQIFKQNGLEARKLAQEAEVQRAVAEAEREKDHEIETSRARQMEEATNGLADGLRRLAGGDLTVRLDKPFAADFEELRSDFNAAAGQLGETLRVIADVTRSIDGGTAEISRASEDLSKRTEQQAASLEETAAALDQITANVTSSTMRAEDARKIAADADGDARSSGLIVSQAIDAMHRIEKSSTQVANIIGVIDEIAFQTNLLALNAGVEAARAGEAGKGFAVVASEVRELAQRSAQAAKEIRELIRTSSVEVESGVQLVARAGESLKSIGSLVVSVNHHMDAIATSAREQSVALAEVNSAVNQMDQVTQQNAAMVEESNAASSTLAAEANRLRRLVAGFTLAENTKSEYGDADASSSRQKPVSAVHILGAQVRQAFGGQRRSADWQEF
ncbi:methyl-accepting chemotaxis protein [Rhizobium sp. LjRoot30]|uniref:methyl-accepting chemotaxis protein n=1 Tax=Rhizobium sp. LjRoot30 TaxID=3342320 RepID=UPI003ECF14D7